MLFNEEYLYRLSNDGKNNLLSYKRISFIDHIDTIDFEFAMFLCAYVV